MTPMAFMRQDTLWRDPQGPLSLPEQATADLIFCEQSNLDRLARLARQTRHRAECLGQKNRAVRRLIEKEEAEGSAPPPL